MWQLAISYILHQSYDFEQSGTHTLRNVQPKMEKNLLNPSIYPDPHQQCMSVDPPIKFRRNLLSCFLCNPAE